LGNIKRIILDVLKPHNPSILELAEHISELDGISGVNISLEEMDEKTHTVKITIEGPNIDYDKVQRTIMNSGAEVHSIDGVSAGIKIVEEVNTPQDR
jgi:uncharacterized protein